MTAALEHRRRPSRVRAERSARRGRSRSTSPPSTPGEAELHAFNLVLADEARAAADAARRPGRRGRGPRAAGRRAGRAQGQPLHPGHPHHLLARRSSRAGSRPTTPPSSSAWPAPGPIAGRQDQPRRVRHGLLHRELGLRPDPQPPRPDRGARRVVGRQRGGGGRRLRPRRRSAPTPAARSASPPPCAAWSGMKPTYGRVSPLRPGRLRLVASTRSARSPPPWPTPPPLSRSSPATTPSTPPRSPSRPAGRPPHARPTASTGCASGSSPSSWGRGHRPRRRWPGPGEAAAALEAAGATVGEASVPAAIYGLSAYYLIAPAEASSNLARYDGVRYGLRVDAANHRRDERRPPAPPGSAPR